MKVEIVERADAKVLGIMARINPMNADYSEIWGNQFDPRQEEITPLAVDDGYYGVYYATGQEGMADFVAGMVVRDTDAVPDGLVLREIAGGTYALFSCTMSSISATWGQIYSQWMPASGYAEDTSRPSFEYYRPGEMGPDAPVAIYVPLVGRE